MNCIDFNSRIQWDLSFSKGEANVSRANHFLPGSGASAPATIPYVRQTIPGQLQSPPLYLSQSVPGDDLCATDLSRKSARHRSMSSGNAAKALPYGHSGQSLSQYIGSCQRGARLTHLRRLRSDSHRPGSSTLCRRGFWQRASGCNHLCTQRDHDRSLPVAIPVGALSTGEGCGKTPYVDGSSWQHPLLYPYTRRQVTRRKHPGSLAPGVRCLLRHGQSLPGLRTPLRTRSGSSILRHKGQTELSVPASILERSGQINRASVRSDHRTEHILHKEIIPGYASTYPLPRSGYGEASHLSDKPVQVARADDHSTLQNQVEDRTVLQMDKATSADQGILWYIAERCENTDLDRRYNVSPSGDTQERTRDRAESLHHSTGFKRISFRENAYTASGCGTRVPGQRPILRQTAAIARVTLGHY